MSEEKKTERKEEAILKKDDNVLPDDEMGKVNGGIKDKLYLMDKPDDYTRRMRPYKGAEDFL